MFVRENNTKNKDSDYVSPQTRTIGANLHSFMATLKVTVFIVLLFPYSSFANDSNRDFLIQNSALSSANVFYSSSIQGADSRTNTVVSMKSGNPDDELAGPDHVIIIPENKLSAPSLSSPLISPKKQISKKLPEKSCGPRIAKLKADCVITHAGVRVKSVPNFVCEFDKDKDGVLDADDSCPNTPPRTRVYDNGCTVPIIFPEGILYRINSEFDFNKFNLRSDALKVIDRLVKDLNSTLHNEKVKIVGHTDSRGSDAYNIKLSKQRAGAVSKYLISKGIKRYTITVDGKGEREPIATNDTDEGRALNRRIDVRVEGKEEGYKTGKYADGSGCPVPATTATYTLTAQFDTGSAELKPDAVDSLDEILDKLKATPLEEVLNVVGHTDARGSDEKNELLSLQRAQSAADYLIKQGIPKTHVIVDGEGETSPIDSNETKSGRRNNRRIEIRTR